MTSTGFVRGKLQSLAVVRGSNALAKPVEHEHIHQMNDDPVADALSDVRAQVLEAAGSAGVLPGTAGVHWDRASSDAQRAEAASNPVASAVATLEARLSIETPQPRRASLIERARAIVEARIKGYEGDACGACGNFTLVRNGTCMKCDTCGSTSGCS